MNTSEWIADFIRRENEEHDAEWRAGAEALRPRGRKRVRGQSTAYSIRLDPDEVAALERRAAAVGLGPTVLARNLIRIGLSGRANAEFDDALDRLLSAAEELRGYSS